MSITVAIVGRPNVGKSTLFNRLIGKKKAIVDDMSGVTRDRIYDYSDWAGKEFIVIDTGGYVKNTEDVFEREIRKQVTLAIQEAHILLFMLDITVGITHLEDEIANILRKSNKPVLVVANKADNNRLLSEVYEFYKLGFEEVFPLSSINGSGTGELLDALVEKINLIEKQSVEIEKPDLPKFAVVGRPNVGKSTFINTLLGEERHIVSDIPGTTRDSIHSVFNKYGLHFQLIDTAGIRKKTKVNEDVEFYSVIRAVKAIEESDVCFLMIDSQSGIESQDMSILDLIHKRGKGLIILINKWDLIEKENATARDYISQIQEKIAPFNDVPVIPISVLEKQRIMKSLEEGLRVYENRKKKISTSQLNKHILAVIENYHPPSVKGKIIRIKYATQVKTEPPVIAFFCNHPSYVKESYKRFLENKIREFFDFSGVPLKLLFKNK
jgi:GTPase